MSIHFSDRLAQFTELKLTAHILILGYALLVAKAAFWFMGLADPSATQLGFITAIVGVSPVMFTFFLSYIGGTKDATLLSVEQASARASAGG